MTDHSDLGGRRTPEESRALIVQGARLALAELGLGEMTVGDVMDRTPLGRSSFYLHFKDLGELILFLLEQNVNLFAAPSSVWFAEPSVDTMELGLRGIIEVWAPNRGWWGELITAAMAPRREVAAQWRRSEVDNWSPMIAALIPEDGPAIQAGATTDGVARTFVLMLFGVLADRSGEEALDVDQLADEVVAIAKSLLYGVAA